MHLFVDISAHGFGHLAVTAPIIRALAERVTDLRLTVRSALPADNLRERIGLPFTLWPEASDFGFRMIDANRIDLVASANDYRAAHADWPSRVDEETRRLALLQPDIILSCVSYLPLAAAHRLGIPSAAVSSLNWASLFAHMFGQQPWAGAIYRQILDAYAGANAFLRTVPGMPMPELDNVCDIGLIVSHGRKHDLGLGSDKAVLVTMGGIAHRLPIDRWPNLPGIRWLVPAKQLPRHSTKALAWESFGLSFTDLFCSVDAAIGKPGYGTFADAGGNGVPLLYQLRDNWPEQDCLIDWLKRHGRLMEIDAGQMREGHVGPALEALWQQAVPPRPVADGAAEAARQLIAILGEHRR